MIWMTILELHINLIISELCNLISIFQLIVFENESNFTK